MTRRYFDKTTATNKLGKKIQTLVEFSGVPGGTTGRVIRADVIAYPFAVGGAPVELYISCHRMGSFRSMSTIGRLVLER